jgi:nucleotide-binding universal stress UspA family protein
MAETTSAPGPGARYVVAAVDGSDDGTRALEYAISEAGRLDLGLRIVHVQPETVVMGPMLPMVPGYTLHEVGVEVLKEAEQQARRLGWTGPDLDAVLETGPRLAALLRHVDDAACVVVGRRGSAAQHMLTGSTTSSLAAHAPVPVLSVPDGWHPHGRPGVVTVGLESFEGVDRILATAFDEARSRHARVEVLHAWRPVGVYDAAIRGRVDEDQWAESIRDVLTTCVHRAMPGSDVEWFAEAVYDRPVSALRAAGERADLLVVGRRGHVGLPFRHLGPVTATLMRSAGCPVLVVPDEPR